MTTLTTTTTTTSSSRTSLFRLEGNTSGNTAPRGQPSLNELLARGLSYRMGQIREQFVFDRVGLVNSSSSLPGTRALLAQILDQAISAAGSPEENEQGEEEEEEEAYHSTQ